MTTTHPTVCPYCQHVAFDEAEECCDSCGFHRRCAYCETVISDTEAMALNHPKHCGRPACAKEYWDEANVAWQDAL